MIADRLREICLAFPEVTERLSHGTPTWFVRGTKTFVTNGGHADSYVISGVTPDGDATAPGRFSCLVLGSDADGLVWGGPWRGLGMRGNSSRTLELEEVRLPRRDLLGGEGDQLWYVFHVVAPYFLMAMSGTYLGVAAAALEEARAHLRSRMYGFTGRTLASEPVLQHRFGVLWGAVERTRRLVYHAAAAADAGDPDALAGVLRGADIFAHWDGGDLLALLPDTDRTGGARVVQRVRDATGASVGVAHWGGDLAEDLIERAERALASDLAQA
jgi:alkylation response protein AidB-like acyl-CoA dehydrogenase